MAYIELETLHEMIDAELRDRPIERGYFKMLSEKAVTENTRAAKSARWIASKSSFSPNMYTCSNCDRFSPSDFKTDFCPNCGARMDAEGGAD